MKPDSRKYTQHDFTYMKFKKMQTDSERTHENIPVGMREMLREDQERGIIEGQEKTSVLMDVFYFLG